MKNRYYFRYLLILLFFIQLAPSQARAQRYITDYDSIKALIASCPDSTRHGFFNAGKFNSTFHVQFDGDVTYLYQQVAAMTGFQVAWVANHKLSIGAKFDILTTQVRINKYINSHDSIGTTPNPIHPLSMSGMVTVGYIFRSDKKISIEPDLGLGWSYMSFTDPIVGWIDQTEPKKVNFISNYFIANPSLSVIWNTTKYFRIGAVAGVQGVFGTDYLRLKTYRIRGLYGGLFLRFGTF
jgi:hypothetical protein